MCKSLFSFSAGLTAGFIAGTLIDNKNRLKIQELLKEQVDKLKPIEKRVKETIDDGIDKVINSIQNVSKPKRNK